MQYDIYLLELATDLQEGFTFKDKGEGPFKSSPSWKHTHARHY